MKKWIVTWTFEVEADDAHDALEAVSEGVDTGALTPTEDVEEKNG